MFDDLFKRIDDKLNPKDQIKKTNYSLFENKMAKSLGMVTESLDSYLNVIERPVNKNPGPIFDYLKTLGPNELDDWVNALEIAVVEREGINRWALSLAEKTEELALSQQQRVTLAGVKEALGVAPWSDPNGPPGLDDRTDDMDDLDDESDEFPSA